MRTRILLHSRMALTGTYFPVYPPFGSISCCSPRTSVVLPKVNGAPPTPPRPQPFPLPSPQRWNPDDLVLTLTTTPQVSWYCFTDVFFPPLSTALQKRSPPVAFLFHISIFFRPPRGPLKSLTGPSLGFFLPYTIARRPEGHPFRVAFSFPIPTLPLPSVSGFFIVNLNRRCISPHLQVSKLLCHCEVFIYRLFVPFLSLFSLFPPPPLDVPSQFSFEDLSDEDTF